jgi:hypothetical protein
MNSFLVNLPGTLSPLGIVEDKPELLKQRVGYDYSNQLAFIEGMLPPDANPKPNS